MDPMMNESADVPKGYTIELKISADGAISVSVEPESMEMAEPVEPTESDGQPVANIREAIKVVMDIYSNAGQQSDTNVADDQMEQGFKPGL